TLAGAATSGRGPGPGGNGGTGKGRARRESCWGARAREWRIREVGRTESADSSGNSRGGYKLTMKVKIKCWNGVASWLWVANDENCGICRMAFNGCCPDCEYICLILLPLLLLSSFSFGFFLH
uniref:Anaphase-promoting complex subunit 11 RING-H2 finger domain-containing protein n=1 Tax=Vombatus ursinus TaxID=29139 RepID=A0A4X2KH88_VOMUR